MRGRNRRVSPVAFRPGEGPLTKRTAGVQRARREQIFMHHTRRSRYPWGSAQLGGRRLFSCALTLAGPRQSRRISSHLFLIEPPRAIPVGGGRVGLEEVDTPDKCAGRPVAGGSLKCRAKCATRFVPLACPICGKAFRISGPQQ